MRGDVLRIGFGIYQDEGDVDRLVRVFGGTAAMNVASTARRSASVVLALLLVAYIFNYLDRQILGILAGPIIAELHLNDRQFGLLSGPPFAILYSVLGIPFAFLADRTSRSRVIAAAVAFWSAFTGLCGTADLVLAILRLPHGRRHRRSGRRRAVLCA